MLSATNKAWLSCLRFDLNNHTSEIIEYNNKLKVIVGQINE